MADNPWFVDSLQSFWHLKCPECTFDSKEEGTFKYHAVTKHPLSLVLFGKEFNYPVENPTTDLIKIEISKEEPKPVDKSFMNENEEFLSYYYEVSRVNLTELNTETNSCTKELDDIGGDPGLVLGENGPKTVDQCILDFYHENLKCQLPWSKCGILCINFISTYLYKFS